MTTKNPSSWDAPFDSAPRTIVRKMHFLIETNRRTVHQVAAGLDITSKSLQDVLDGVSHPTEGLIEKFAKFFGVSIGFITGQEPAKPGPARSGPSGRRTPSSSSPARPRPGTPPSSSRGRTPAPANGGNVLLATRIQALVELLVEKGIITAREYSERVQQVEQRNRPS